MGPREIASSLLVGFAALSLVLAFLGIYGVSSYIASQRTKEMGIRLALGATPGEVFSIVLTGGATLTLAGLIAGTMSYLVLERGLASVTYGVSGNDPLMIAVGAAALACAAGIAILPVGVRSARANPVDALRAE
jgi:ABC-type antimicrobial peptide transport system permease subunit